MEYELVISISLNLVEKDMKIQRIKGLVQITQFLSD